MAPYQVPLKVEMVVAERAACFSLLLLTTTIITTTTTAANSAAYLWPDWMMAAWVVEVLEVRLDYHPQRGFIV